MPVRGTKPKPTMVKMLAGNPGHRPLPKNEPTPAAVGDGFAPPMCPEARLIWDEIVPPMVSSRMMLSTDVAMAKVLCEQMAIYRQAHEIVRRRNGFTSKRTGQVSTALTAMNKALSTIRALAADFGMTPSARVRVVATPDKVSSEEDAYFSEFA